MDQLQIDHLSHSSSGRSSDFSVSMDSDGDGDSDGDRVVPSSGLFLFSFSYFRRLTSVVVLIGYLLFFYKLRILFMFYMMD